MSLPMKKDQPELQEDLTTADLAQRKRPAPPTAATEDRPKPVLAKRPGESAENVSSGRGTFELEQQWDRGDDVSTEDLRIALQRYRSFFQRLLSI
jgi:hypothetical protein